LYFHKKDKNSNKKVWSFNNNRIHHDLLNILILIMKSRKDKFYKIIKKLIKDKENKVLKIHYRYRRN